ncbi:MAG: hypothetical protein IJ272_02620, partial [Clostridia bacterium]|nr:hypothetical protein [Clostridia bacterium]
MGLYGYTSASGVDSGRGYRTSISIISEELTDTVAFFDTETSVVAGDYLILGVDFYVQSNGWKFPENPVNFFTESSNAGNKKVVDIECIYEGGVRWHQKDLNAEVIKMVKPDMTVLPVSEISKDTTYSDGKYTLVVRVGGKNGDTAVFMPMENMDAKIVVNELNLKSAAGDLIKIGNIPNNKVRLNIFGESGSNAIEKVVLKTAPTKLDYELEEELNLSGGIIVPYLGSLAGEEISITIENIHEDDRNITNTAGEHLVRLKYNGIDVIQDDVKFIINVSATRQLTVNDVVMIGTNTVNSHFIEGPGKYTRADSDVTESLKAYEFLNGYMFSNWSSDSTYVKAANNNYSTTFTV